MPNNKAKSRFVSRSKTFSRVASIIVILIGALVFLGWLFDISELKNIYGGITMKSNTAVSLILTGAALSLLPVDRKLPRLLGQICAAGAALIGLLTLSEHVLGWNLHIDQLLFTEPAGALATNSPGRMGITASTDFVLFGAALLLLYRQKAVSVAQFLSIIAGLWALLSIIGYAYQAEQLFAMRYTGIALKTAIALFILSLGILLSSVNQGFLSIISDDDAAGFMTRRLVIIAVLVPVILGGLLLAGQRAGHFDLGLGTALLVIANIVFFLIAVWGAATRLKTVERQRLATAAIAEQGEERLRRQAVLIDLSYEPILVWIFGGPIVEWNKGCEEIYGYSRQEAVGKISHELLRTKFPISRETFQAERERDGRWSGELRHVTRDGQEVLIETRQQLIESLGQRLVLETNRDITERKRVELEREQLLVREHDLRRAAEAASRIKDEFLATISHELRTPLNAILGWATMLRNRQGDNATVARGLEVIERNAKSQAQLIEDLLDMSRIISGRMRLDIKPVVISFVIKAGLDSVRPAAEAKQIRLETVVDPAADDMRADEARCNR